MRRLFYNVALYECEIIQICGSFDSISLRNYHSRWPWTGRFLIFRNRLENDAADLFDPDLWYRFFFLTRALFKFLPG